jgi:hypothetical protein
MDIVDNDGDGKSVILVTGDRLDMVPKSHRNLLTPAIRKAFSNPTQYFGRIASRCPFSQMARWLKRLLADDDWELQLHRGIPKKWTMTGFLWCSERVRSAIIGTPSETDLGHYPKVLQRYYALVNQVQWMPFGCSGGLDGAGHATPLSEIGMDIHAVEVDPLRTFIWGTSPCGDMLIYTQDGRGGWLCHENGHIHLLGTIEATIDWVYGELLADQCPDYDYDWT